MEPKNIKQLCRVRLLDKGVQVKGSAVQAKVIGVQVKETDIDGMGSGVS
jgi:hypothetical protein